MEVFSLLDSSPIVLSYSIVDFKYWETGSYVKMQIVLIDKSVLHVREYNDEFERNYSFHWQDSKGAFLLRWDNAPHHKNLKTFPQEAYLFGSAALDLADEDSDIDVAIVSDSFAGIPFYDVKKISKFRRAVDLRLEVHPFSLKEIRFSPSAFFLDIKREGFAL